SVANTPTNTRARKAPVAVAGPPGGRRFAMTNSRQVQGHSFRTMSASVELQDVCADFGSFRAVDNVSVTIQAGEFFSFLGPSGCGKTTILRMVSGFVQPTSGTVRIGGKDMRDQRPNQRPTALIFQNLALFPLMPVWENIAFGLEVRGVDRKL